MSLFKFNKQTIEPVVNKDEGDFEMFNIFEIPTKANLPVVNKAGRGGLVPFSANGYGFTYPSLIEQSYYEASPAHKSCIKLLVSSVISQGYEFDIEGKSLREISDLNAFKSSINFDSFLRDITLDFRLHNRINIKVTKTSSSIIFERINPSKIGYNKSKTKFYYSEDYIKYQTPQKIYPKYEIGAKNGEYMIEFDGYVGKFDPYPVPEWIAGFEYIKINSQIPSFHSANMENSINPSMIIKKVAQPMTAEERKDYLTKLFNMKGTKNTGKALLFTANSPEYLPEIQQLDANNNGNLFRELRTSTIDDICMAHNTNPILIGVKTPGSLGMGKEYEIAYHVFYETEVKEAISHIEKVINQLLYIKHININFKLKENKGLEI